MADLSDDDLLQINDCIGTWSSKMATASDFQRLHNAIMTNLTKMTNNTSDLEKLVQKLGTSEDSEPLRERYLRLQNETKSLMQQTNHDLQKLKDTPVTSEADQRQKRSLVDTLPKRYLDILNRFQEAQRIGARKEKDSLERTRAETYRQQSMNDSSIANEFSSSNAQFQQQVVLPMEQDVNMQGIRERDEQLRQLETNIVEVNEIFKDVAKIVHEHGGIVDAIDRHVLEAEDNVVHANQQLTKAVTYQTSARRKKIILFVIVIVLLIIVAMVLYFTLKK